VSLFNIDADIPLKEEDVETGPPLLAHEQFTASNEIIREEYDDGAPLFAHESIGEHQRSASRSSEEFSRHRSWQKSMDYDLTDYDMNDPHLEKFPSSREDILETVRKIGTGMNEDRAALEGYPPSPIVGPRGSRGSIDYGNENLSLSPTASPTMTRAPRRLDFSPSRSTSVVSLHSIAEEAGSDDVPEPVVVRLPSPRLEPNTSDRSPPTDEDEGIVLKTTDNTLNQGRHAKESPKGTTSEIPRSPRIVLHPADSASDFRKPDATEVEATGQGNEETGAGDTQHGASSGLDASEDTGSLRRRGLAERSATPASVHSAHMEATKNGNWIRAIFRMIFVEWLGGFFSRLWRGRRKE